MCYVKYSWFTQSILLTHNQRKPLLQMRNVHDKENLKRKNTGVTTMWNGCDTGYLKLYVQNQVIESLFMIIQSSCLFRGSNKARFPYDEIYFFFWLP